MIKTLSKLDLKGTYPDKETYKNPTTVCFLPKIS